LTKILLRIRLNLEIMPTKKRNQEIAINLNSPVLACKAVKNQQWDNSCLETLQDQLIESFNKDIPEHDFYHKIGKPSVFGTSIDEPNYRNLADGENFRIYVRYDGRGKGTIIGIPKESEFEATLEKEEKYYQEHRGHLSEEEKEEAQYTISELSNEAQFPTAVLDDATRHGFNNWIQDFPNAFGEINEEGKFIPIKKFTKSIWD
jgi:hypothetical protein